MSTKELTDGIKAIFNSPPVESVSKVEPIVFEPLKGLDTLKKIGASTQELFSPTSENMQMAQSTDPYADPNFNPDKYTRLLGDTFDPNDPNLNAKRAQAQGSLEQFGAMLNQAVVGEIVGGTIAGIGTLLDVFDASNYTNDHEKKWSNGISEFGESIRDWTKDATAVYATSPGQFKPWEFSWWMDNGASIASTLSLMLPAAGVMKGLTWGAKALKATERLGSLGMSTKAIETLGKGASIVGQAILSRHMENTQEATQNYDETYAKYSPLINPESKFTEEKAKELASNSAALTYRADAGMLLMDIAQYAMLPKFKVNGEITERTAKTIAKLGLPPEATIAAIRAKKAAIGLVEAGGEGVEEGYQYMMSMEGKRLADKQAGLLTPEQQEGFGSRILNYAGDPEFWTSAVMGSIGGGVFQAVGPKVQDWVNKSKGIVTQEDKKNQNLESMSENFTLFKKQVNDAKLSGDSEDMDIANLTFDTNYGTNAIKNGNTKQAVQYLEGQLQELQGKTQEQAEADGITDLPGLIQATQEHITNINELKDRTQKHIKKYGETAPYIAESEFLVDRFGKKIDSLEQQYNALVADDQDRSKLSLPTQDMLRLTEEKVATDNIVSVLLNKTQDGDKKAEEITSDSDKIIFKQRAEQLTQKSAELQKQIDELKVTPEYVEAQKKEKKTKALKNAIVNSQKNMYEISRIKLYQDVYTLRKDHHIARIEELISPNIQKKTATNKVIIDQVLKLQNETEIDQFEKNFDTKSVYLDQITTAVRMKRQSFVNEEKVANGQKIKDLVAKSDVTVDELENGFPEGHIADEDLKVFNDKKAELLGKEQKDIAPEIDLEELHGESHQTLFDDEGNLVDEEVNPEDQQAQNAEEIVAEQSSEPDAEHLVNLQHVIDGTEPDDVVEPVPQPQTPEEQEKARKGLQTLQGKKEEVKPPIEEVKPAETKEPEIKVDNTDIQSKLNEIDDLENQTGLDYMTEVEQTFNNTMKEFDLQNEFEAVDDGFFMKNNSGQWEDIGNNEEDLKRLLGVPVWNKLNSKLTEIITNTRKKTIDINNKRSKILFTPEGIKHRKDLSLNDVHQVNDGPWLAAYISPFEIYNNEGNYTWINYVNGISEQEVIDKINALYDAELKVLEEKEILQPSIKEDTQEHIVTKTEPIIQPLGEEVLTVGSSRRTKQLPNGTFDEEFTKQFVINKDGSLSPLNQFENRMKGKLIEIRYDMVEDPNIQKDTQVEVRIIEPDWWISEKTKKKISEPNEWKSIPIGVYYNGKLIQLLQAKPTTSRKLIYDILKSGKKVLLTVDEKTTYGTYANTRVNIGTEKNEQWVPYFYNANTLKKRWVKVGNKWVIKESPLTLALVFGTEDNRKVVGFPDVDLATGLPINTGTIGRNMHKPGKPNVDVGHLYIITTNSHGEISPVKATTATINKKIATQVVELMQKGNIQRLTQIIGLSKNVPNVLSLSEEEQGYKFATTIGELTGERTSYFFTDEKFTIYYSNKYRKYFKIRNDLIGKNEGYAMIMTPVEKIGSDGNKYLELTQAEGVTEQGATTSLSGKELTGVQMMEDLVNEISVKKYQIHSGFLQSKESYSSPLNGSYNSNNEWVGKKYDSYLDYLTSEEEGAERPGAMGSSAIIAVDVFNDHGTVFHSTQIKFDRIIVDGVEQDSLSIPTVEKKTQAEIIEQIIEPTIKTMPNETISQNGNVAEFSVPDDDLDDVDDLDIDSGSIELGAKINQLTNLDITKQTAIFAKILAKESITIKSIDELIDLVVKKANSVYGDTASSDQILEILIQIIEC